MIESGRDCCSAPAVPDLTLRAIAPSWSACAHKAPPVSVSRRPCQPTLDSPSPEVNPLLALREVRQWLGFRRPEAHRFYESLGFAGTHRGYKLYL